VVVILIEKINNPNLIVEKMIRKMNLLDC
jgi:hypothetical protein